MEEECRKSYYAIIPANVRYDKELKPNAKLLYGEITALANENGFCWATNNYFAELYEVAKETISRWIKQLADKGYIDVEMIYDGKELKERRIYISKNQRVLTEKSKPLDENVNRGIDKIINRGIDEKVKENNTSMNNTSMNKREIYKEKDDRIVLGEFRNVRMTFKQLDSLKDKFVDWEDRIERLSGYKAQTGKRYKNDYATILVWARKEEKSSGKKEEKKGDVYDGF